MKVLVCDEPGKLSYQEHSNPVLQKDHAIIKIKRVGICGTDLHAFEGTQPYFSYPRILGHELSGELVEADNTPTFNVGDRVTILPYYNCGHCIACLRGHPNCCVHMKVCGVHVDGGMVEQLMVPATALVHSHDLNADVLALVEPLAIGAHGVGRAHVEAGEFVLVIGAGPIGLGIMEFARIAGATVITLDINEQRLTYCQEKLNIEHTIHGVTANVLEALREITNGNMPTVVIDATGSLKAINNAFQYLAHGGRYVLVGLQKGDITFSHPEFHKREATLMSSRNATREDFERVIHSIKNNIIKPEKFITHRVGFNEVRDTFSSWLNPANGVIKAMVEFD